MRVPRRTTPSASVALSSPASSPSSSSRGKKTGSARGAHGVRPHQVQCCALPSRSHLPSLATAWLQLATTRWAACPFVAGLSCNIRCAAGVYDLAQHPRLQLLHRLEHGVLNLGQGGFRMRLAPLRDFLSYRLARRQPPRQDLLDLVLAHPPLRPPYRLAGASLYRITQNYAGHPVATPE